MAQQNAHNPMRLLLTRPLRDSAEFSEILEKRGYKTLISPMIEIIPLPFAPPAPLESFDALIFTSANAVRAFAGQNPFRTPPTLYAVGPQTAHAAQALGFHNIIAAAGDGTALTRCILDHIGANDPQMTRRMLHLRGEILSTDPRHALEKQENILVESLICYRADAASTLSPEAVHFLETGKIDAALFFSARSAEIFLSLALAMGLHDALTSLRALCLSHRVVKSLQAVPWRGIEVARTPDREGMLALLPDRTTGA